MSRIDEFILKLRTHHILSSEPSQEALFLSLLNDYVAEGLPIPQPEEDVQDTEEPVEGEAELG